MAQGQIITIGAGHLYLEDLGSGTAVVFLHGFSLDSRMWQHQLRVFARSYRVIAYDALGFGRSSLPSGPVSPVSDLTQVLECCGVDRCFVVAHSMAAIVACDFCYECPERVAGLVLVSPAMAGYPWPAEMMAQWSAYRELAALDLDAARRAWLGDALFVRALEQPGVAASLRRMVDDYSGWHWLQQVPVTQGSHGAETLSQLRQSVLIVSGEDDNEAFLDCADRLVRCIPDAERHLMPATDHLCAMEQAGRFDRLLLAFLRHHE